MRSRFASLVPVAVVAATIASLSGLPPPAGAQERAATSRPARLRPEDVRALSPDGRAAPALRFEATVFRVDVAPARVSTLDPQALATVGPTPIELAAVLARCGATALLYRLDQVIAADGEKTCVAEVARSQPYIAGIGETPSGQIVTSASRDSVVCRLDVAARYHEGAERQRLQLTVQGEVRLLDDTHATEQGWARPIRRSVRQEHTGDFEVSRPLVLVGMEDTLAANDDLLPVIVTLLRVTAAPVAAPPPRPAKPLRFESTMFQLEFAPGRVFELDAAALTAASASLDQFTQNLQALGTAKALFSLDQVITADGGPGTVVDHREEWQLDTLPPSREKVGYRCIVSAFLPDAANQRGVQLSLRTVVSTATGSTLQLGPDRTAPIFWRACQTYAGAVELDRPFALVAADCLPAISNDKALAFVAYVRLSKAASAGE